MAGVETGRVPDPACAGYGMDSFVGDAVGLEPDHVLGLISNDHPWVRRASRSEPLAGRPIVGHSDLRCLASAIFGERAIQDLESYIPVQSDNGCIRYGNGMIRADIAIDAAAVRVVDRRTGNGRMVWYAPAYPASSAPRRFHLGVWAMRRAGASDLHLVVYPIADNEI